jgi:SAM-dependent methyltransferase
LSNLFFYSILSIILTIYIQNNFITNSILEIILKYTLLVGPFAFVQGGIFPILLNLNTYHSENISRSSGSLYLLNSLGAFCIAGISQFILFRIIGLSGVIYFLICLNIVSMFIIYLDESALNKFKNKIILSLLILLLVSSFDNNTWNMYTHLQDSNNITSAEGSTGTATITWHEKPLSNGVVGDVRINNHYNSGLPNHPSHIEFEIFGLSAKNKGKLLLLGLGGGGMLRELNDDASVEEIRVIDWSNELKYILSSKRAKNLLKDVLNSKKVNLTEGDARQYVNIENSLSKDIVIDNLAYTYMSGASSVKSEEYYKQISRLVKEDGIFILGINGRNSLHSKAVISGVLRNFKSVYSLNNILIASNSSLDCFFKQNTFENKTKICPINKSKFFSFFDQHIDKLPATYSELDAQKYLDKFTEHLNEDFEDILPIKDNFPIFEYYFCFDLKNPKCR